MNVKSVIRQALQTSAGLLKRLMADLADTDLAIRPVPGANTLAWQLGHLISSEARFHTRIGSPAVELPAGFADQYTRETAASDTGFLGTEQYLGLFDRVRSTTLAALESFPEADLDKDSPAPIARLAPKLGDLFLFQANHVFMHLGQFSVVRRKLGKPVLL